MEFDSKFVKEMREVLANLETEDVVAKKYSGVANRDVSFAKYLVWKNYVRIMNRSAKQVIGAFMLSVCNYFWQSEGYATISCIGDTADVKSKIAALREFSGYNEIVRGVQHDGVDASYVVFTMAENLNDVIPEVIIDFNTFSLEEVQSACSHMYTNTNNFKGNAPAKKLAFFILLKMYKNLREGVKMSDTEVVESVFKDEGILDADDYLFG